jgi:hypothetical protein
VTRPPLVFFLSLTVGACTVDPPTLQQGTDAAPGGDGALAVDAAGAIDATPICTDQQPPEATRHHPLGYEYSEAGSNGSGCLGQCHNDILGPRFSVGGSVWDRRLEGGNPIGGATVVVIDAAGKVETMITNADGQFWSRAVLQAPIRTYASACPDSIPMVASTTGNCASAACHPSSAKIYLAPPL